MYIQFVVFILWGRRFFLVRGDVGGGFVVGGVWYIFVWKRCGLGGGGSHYTTHKRVHVQSRKEIPNGRVGFRG